jgi:hypothetical protein
LGLVLVVRYLVESWDYWLFIANQDWLSFGVFFHAAGYDVSIGGDRLLGLMVDAFDLVSECLSSDLSIWVILHFALLLLVFVEFLLILVLLFDVRWWVSLQIIFLVFLVQLGYGLEQVVLLHPLVGGLLLFGEGDCALGVEELADSVAHDQGALHIVEAVVHVVVWLPANHGVPDKVLSDIVYFLYVVPEFIWKPPVIALLGLEGLDLLHLGQRLVGCLVLGLSLEDGLGVDLLEKAKVFISCDGLLIEVVDELLELEEPPVEVLPKHLEEGAHLVYQLATQILLLVVLGLQVKGGEQGSGWGRRFELLLFLLLIHHLFNYYILIRIK